MFKLPRTCRDTGRIHRRDAEYALAKWVDADAGLRVGGDGVHGVGGARGGGGDGECDCERL